MHKHYWNIGIAADTDKGLLVPVVKHADRKSIFEISDEINELAVKARDGKSLSFDHRQIDGATGQNAMNHIKRLLNNPELLLMEG
ncbi:putative dihydrolipoamide acyltransferase component [Mycobacteroides abscessus subsp. massiliense]|nr:putative dihydrolipoamide acyltransferase component [Mycobacteroides abscessus subsp. massiliense]